MPRVATTSNITNPKRYGYDIQLDNIFLRTAVGPNRDMTIQSSDVQAGQNVNVKQNPEDFTSNLGRIYSRNKFNAGQGLDTAHRTDGKPDDVNRFWDSKGIDVFHGDDETSYHIHLLHQTADVNVRGGSLQFAGTNNYMTQTTDGKIWVTDNTSVYYSTDATTWTEVAAGTNNATHNFTGIAAFGNKLFLTTANGIASSQLIEFDGTSTWSVRTTAQSSSGGLTGVWFVKNRLWITGNDGTAEYIWEASPFNKSWSSSDLQDADSIVEVEPTHEFTGIIDGGAAVLASSTDGTVYSFKLSSGSFVNQGQTKIPFEEVHSIEATEGIVFLGTKESTTEIGRLYRTELVAADDLYVLANRQLVKEWVVTGVDTTPHAMFVSRDSVYMGVKEATNQVNLWRYYLPTGGLARDLQTTGNSFVYGITQNSGKFVISVSGSDIYKEQSTYESEGYLVLSAADFFTAEQKQFVGAELSTINMPTNTEVELLYSTKFEDLDTPESAFFTSALTQLGGTGDAEKQISEVSRYIIGKVVLKSTNNVDTPKVKSVQFRALARPELVVAQIPINISDRVERPGRKPIRVKGLGDELYAALRDKEGDSVTLEIFQPQEIIRGVIEQISYPIQSNEVVGSDTHYAIITVRGTRQTVLEDVTSVNTLGISAFGIMRFGA
ncbi:GGDEF domain protein [uncultured Mediterranean phage uvMED]|nr:GGDEF domain protein [uncultured Mediterranean phage uvMED]